MTYFSLNATPAENTHAFLHGAVSAPHKRDGGTAECLGRLAMVSGVVTGVAAACLMHYRFRITDLNAYLVPVAVAVTPLMVVPWLVQPQSLSHEECAEETKRIFGQMADYLRDDRKGVGVTGRETIPELDPSWADHTTIEALCTYLTLLSGKPIPIRGAHFSTNEAGHSVQTWEYSRDAGLHPNPSPEGRRFIPVMVNFKSTWIYDGQALHSKLDGRPITADLVRARLQAEAN